MNYKYKNINGKNYKLKDLVVIDTYDRVCITGHITKINKKELEIDNGNTKFIINYYDIKEIVSIG